MRRCRPSAYAVKSVWLSAAVPEKDRFESPARVQSAQELDDRARYASIDAGGNLVAGAPAERTAISFFRE